MTIKTHYLQDRFFPLFSAALPHQHAHEEYKQSEVKPSSSQV